jgi:hypothetical protein
MFFPAIKRDFQRLFRGCKIQPEALGGNWRFLEVPETADRLKEAAKDCTRRLSEKSWRTPKTAGGCESPLEAVGDCWRGCGKLWDAPGGCVRLLEAV